MSDVSKFKQDVQVKSGSLRKRELLSSPDPLGAVQALNPIELHQLAEDLGEVDAMDLVALATEEQVKALVDLSSFHRETTDLGALDRWFAAAVAHGHGTPTRLFLALDEELQTLYLHRRLQIYQLHDEEPPEDDKERYKTPDGTFMLELRDADHTGFNPMQLLADLYASDWQAADVMVRDAKWTISTELEDQMLKLREARLADLGFPSYDEAMRLWSKPHPDKLYEPRVSMHATRRSLPARYGEAFVSTSYLADVFARIDEDALLGDLEAELVLLVNAALVAQRTPELDNQATESAAMDVRALLSLGLEIAGRGDLSASVESLRSHTLRSFLRVALADTFRLKAWAEKAVRERLYHLPQSTQMMFDGDESTFVESLTGRLPKLRRRAGDRAKAFGSRAELQIAQKYLEHLSLAAISTKWLTHDYDLPRAFALCEPALEHVTWRPLLRSVLVQRALLERSRIGVTSSDIRALREKYPNPEAPWPLSLGERPVELVSFLGAMWGTLLQDVHSGRGEPQFLDLVVLKGG